MKGRAGWVTLAVVAAALGIAALPGLTPLFTYDRERIFAGEIWRMFTGHWVHFSMQHLIFDLGVIALSGWMIEMRGLSESKRLCFIAPWLISVALMWLEPEMRYFGGLSALATAAVVFLGVEGVRDEGVWRWVCLALLGLVTLKLGFEIASSHSFVSFGETGIRVSGTSHIAGAIIGAVFGLRAVIPACVPIGARAKQVGAESLNHSR